MRRYPQNSPQAAARIVALTLIADGDIEEVELAMLDEKAVHEQLGLERNSLHSIIDTFCEDLLSSQQLAWADKCPVDEYTLTELLGEIDAPDLQRKLLDLCVNLVVADGHVATGEFVVLAAAVEHWGLHRQMLAGKGAVESRLQ